MKIEEIVKKYSNYLNFINITAYKNVFMLSNPTLSKNPYTKTRFLHNIIDNKIEYQSFFKNIIIFYIKNILLFILFLPVFLYIKVISKKEIVRNTKEIILIDSFYGEIELSNGRLKKDKYFKKLYEYMDKEKISYYLVPKFYGFKNPINYIKFYNTFKKSEEKSFIDLEYLTFSDLIQIGIFIVVYPWQVILLQQSIDIKNKIDIIFREDLVYSLSGTDFYPFIRYLFAKNLSIKLNQNKLKVISWCEYQVGDKNFFKGLRVGKGDVKIFATQFLFKYPTYSCLYIPESDKGLSIAPDVILVTGDYYRISNSKYLYKVGPALRYGEFYDKAYHINTLSTKVVVMLPYFQEDAFSLINLLKQSNKFMSMRIDFKIHPDYIYEKKRYQKELVKFWNIIDSYPDFEKYGFVISSGSGSIMELACVGMSVIITASQDSFTTNPMPKKGENENWTLVENIEELEVRFSTLLNFKQNNYKEFEKNILFYRENFLSEVNDCKIKENFEFKKNI